jgi:hypothetical protein
MESPIESRFKQVAANLWEKKDNQVREFCVKKQWGMPDIWDFFQKTRRRTVF